MSLTKTFLSIIFFLSMILSFAYTASANNVDEECNADCTNQEKYGDKYASGKARPNNFTGVCASDEEVQGDICCCKVKS